MLTMARHAWQMLRATLATWLPMRQVADAIHKSKLHGNGTEAQNVVAVLTTAAAICVSPVVDVQVLLVCTVATLTTVAVCSFPQER